jgi:hypothetical protein
MIDDRFPDSSGAVEHEGRTLQPSQLQSCHRAAPPSDRGSRWEQDGLKSVEVMTEHPRPFAWEDVNEVSVRVVGDVKEVKVIALAEQRRWVRYKTRRGSIGIESTPPGDEALKCPEEPRSNGVRLEILAMLLLEVLDKHLRDVVHAAPAFFYCVADDS